MSKHLIIGTAGHVDHGKTALIRALTGIDCDTHKEEKERGITINLGFAHFNLSSGDSVGIVDVPGHKDFIRTMVAGTFGIDMVLLVIAADSGVMPQTIEHLNIIRMLGITHGIIVLTKADLVDEEMLEIAKLEVMDLLEGTPLEQAPVISVSSVTGRGMDTLAAAIADMVALVPERKAGDVFRMYIDRIFNVRGVGFVVTGSVLNGSTEPGKELFLLPGRNRKVKIRSIERHGIQVNRVVAGDRAALNLPGIKAGDFERGMILADRPLEETSMLDATLTLFDDDTRLALWSQMVFYSGTFSCPARVHLLDKDLLQTHDTAIVQIHLQRSVVLFDRDKFIIRNSSGDRTLGGGSIIDVHPLHHKRRTTQLLNTLSTLVQAKSNENSLFELIRLELMKKGTPVTVNEMTVKTGKNQEEIVTACTEKEDAGVILYRTEEQDILVTTESDKDFTEKILNNLRLWHEKNTLDEQGMDAKELAGKLNLISPTGKTYLETLLKKLSHNKTITRAADTWALERHRVTLDSKTQENLLWLEEVIRNYGMQAPVNEDIEALALARNIGKGKVKMMIAYLARQSRLILTGSDYLHASVVDVCRTKLLKTLATKEKGINEKEFRELIGGTRKITQLLISIFLSEEIIAKRTFYLLITEKGRKMGQ
jgi:selenocysteine-specific elongation factor